VNFFLWAGLVIPVYTPYVLRGALRFFNETSRTYQNKLRFNFLHNSQLSFKVIGIWFTKKKKYKCNEV